jgi:hypothetical protein
MTMTTDEAKLKFAIDTAAPALLAAEDAARELRRTDPDKAPDFERDLEIGGIVKRLAFLSGAELRVLSEVVKVLLEYEDQRASSDQTAGSGFA